MGLGLLREMLARGVGLDVFDASSRLDRELVRIVCRQERSTELGTSTPTLSYGQKEGEELSQMEEEERVRKPGRKVESVGLHAAEMSGRMRGWEQGL